MLRDPALAEVLDSLRHDLAKYLSLPLRMLPDDASAEILRAALEQALEHTRRGAHQTRRADEIYAELRAQLLAVAPPATRVRELDETVARALGWRDVLRRRERLDRPAIERDFAALSRYLDDWLDEVHGG
jgi:hypothetical protein